MEGPEDSGADTTDGAGSAGATDIDWWSTLADPGFLRHPYPELARLQALGPVHFDQRSGVYFVLGHAAFARIVKAPQMGRDTRHWADGWCSEAYRARDPLGYRLFSEFHPQMINMDGADHARMRGVYEPAFRAQPTKALVPLVEAEARRLLDALPRRGSVDFMEAYAGPLPLRVLCALFDIPESLDETIGRWSASLIRIGDIMMTPDQKREALDALTEFKAFLREMVAARRAAPCDSLMDMAIRAYDAGTLNEEETLTNLVSMLIAGHETTVTLIGNGMLLLLRHPDQMARLRADPGLMRPAVEEFLRLEPGGNMILRIAREDFEVEGTVIPAGAPVIGLIGAINRDPDRFADPHACDIGRGGNAHFTFGGGAHFCIGAPLARLEAQVAFSELLARFPRIDPDGPEHWRLDRLNARGLARLPVRLEAAS
ncbi:cytochrome P450 [Roseospira navarrensis]|nr:cytochrome P450 [Roseospira navarrensis]